MYKIVLQLTMLIMIIMNLYVQIIIVNKYNYLELNMDKNYVLQIVNINK